MRSTSKQTIPFAHTSLRAAHSCKRILYTLEKVIKSGIFVDGDQNQILEEKLRMFFKSYCTALASGHDSIFLALQALNLQKADEIIFPVNAYPTAFPVFLSGAKPVPVDVDENGQLSIKETKKQITKHTKVIIMVHLYGLMGQVDEFARLTRKHNITLIEDCAQSFGSKYKGKYAGTFGDIACLSFYPTKNLGTLGDGGALITRKKTYDKFFRMARQYGEMSRYKSAFISGHSRLPEIQAAVLNVYLSDFSVTTKAKDNVYDWYLKAFTKSDLMQKIRILQPASDCDPVRHLFVIELSRRNQLQVYLEHKGIETHIHYPYPIHKVSAFSMLRHEHFPVAERLSRTIISLPFHEYITRYNIGYIVRQISKFYGKA